MKQAFAFLTVLSLLGGHLLSAQDLTELAYGRMIMPGVEETSTTERNNRISAEMSIGNIGLRYERMLNPRTWLGANIYANHFWDHDIFGFDVSLRFYPRGNIFFIGFALGYYSFSSMNASEDAWRQRP